MSYHDLGYNVVSSHARKMHDRMAVGGRDTTCTSWNVIKLQGDKLHLVRQELRNDMILRYMCLSRRSRSDRVFQGGGSVERSRNCPIYSVLILSDASRNEMSRFRVVSTDDEKLRSTSDTDEDGIVETFTELWCNFQNMKTRSSTIMVTTSIRRGILRASSLELV